MEAEQRTQPHIVAMETRRLDEGVFLAAHQPVPIPDSEWDPFVETLRADIKRTGVVRVLVRTDAKGGPNVSQRFSIGQLTRLGELRVAVLTRSASIRGIVTALNWISRVEAKAFAPAEAAAAAAHLGLHGGAADDALEALREIVARVENAGP